MKIFVVEIHKNEKPLFYIKPETTQIRNNEALFIPLFCEELRYEFAYAIKINRVTKSICKKFASRCWNEFGVVTNYWAGDMVDSKQYNGNFMDIAYSFDRSFALPNEFLSSELLQQRNNITACGYVNDKEMVTLRWNDIQESIDDIISYISDFITLKIGDVIMIKSKDNANYVAKINDKIELKIENKIIVETLIK